MARVPRLSRVRCGIGLSPFSSSEESEAPGLFDGELPSIYAINDPKRLVQAYAKVSREYFRYPAARPLSLKAALLEWLDVIREDLTNDSHEHHETTGAVTVAISYMRERFRDPQLKCPEICAKVHLNQHHFGRLFKAQTGCSPMQYLKRLRIDYAAELVKSSQMPINAVADHSGFTDPLYFSREFRRFKKMSPVEFRRQA